MKYRVYLTDSIEPQSFVLEVKHSINIGRVAGHKGIDNHIIDQHPSVSKLHATITNTKKGLIFKDNNSKNNTYINGYQILKQVKIKIQEGDEIRLGTSPKLIKIQVVEDTEKVESQQQQQVPVNKKNKEMMRMKKRSESKSRSRSRDNENNKKQLLSSSTLKIVRGMKGKSKQEIVKFLKLMGHKNVEDDWKYIEKQIKGSRGQGFDKMNRDLDEQFSKVIKNKGRRQL